MQHVVVDANGLLSFIPGRLELQSTYRIPGTIAPIIRDLIALPVLLFVDECPWKDVAITAINRYDAARKAKTISPRFRTTCKLSGP